MSISGVLVVLAIVATALTFVQVRQVAFAELERKGTMLADTLNYTFEVLLGQEAYSSLQRVAENSALTADVRGVEIVERNGTVQVSSDRASIGAPTASSFMQQYLADANWQNRIYFTDNNELVLIQPLRGGRSVAQSDGDVVGAVQIMIDRTNAEATARMAALELLGISLGGFLLLAAILFVVLRMLVVRPLQSLVTLTNRFSAGDRSGRSEVKSNDEIGLLSRAFNAMASDVDALLAKLEARVAEAQEARVAAEAAQAKIAGQLATIEQQRLAIRDMSVPILPLSASTLVMPLVGALDTERLRIMQQQALQAVEKNGARTLIMDITGVPVLDTQVAQGIFQVVQACRLLGAQVILVGVRPEVAQTVVGLGIDLSAIRTLTTLEAGIARALGDVHIG
jgi:rsbT co-antagonist protein RsbR